MNDLLSCTLNWFVTGEFAPAGRPLTAAAVREAELDAYTRTNVAAGHPEAACAPRRAVAVRRAALA